MSSESKEDGGVTTSVILDTIKIQQIIPHRYPFLMVDRIVEFKPRHSIVAIKAVTANEPYFSGHFPGQPVMPGVLILEAMAQTGAIMAKLSPDAVAADKSLYLTGATDVKWKRQVTPGDTLRITMTFIKHRRPLWIMSGEVTVDGKLVCSGTVQAAEV